MDLLSEEYNKKTEKPKGQKVILISLISSVVLLVILIGVMALLPRNNRGKKYSILLNGQTVSITEKMLRNDEKGNIYISLKEISNLLGYKFYKGEYGVAIDENKIKCYIESKYEIIGFEGVSNSIFKTTKDSKTDYQYFELQNEIMISENQLYIELNDLQTAFDVVSDYSEKENQTTIKTLDNLAKFYEQKVTEKGYDEIDIEDSNVKTIAHKLLIVSKDGKKGVIDTNSEEIIGLKYDSIKFNEYTLEFIVSNSNQYGTITIEGKKRLNLGYDEIEIINYNPLLYSIKKDKKYEIINKEGQIFIDKKYDKLGYEANENKNAEYTLVIPKQEKLKNNVMVVYNKEEGYGLIDIYTAEEIIPCSLQAIYYKVEDSKKIYVVELQEQIIELNTYIEYLYTKVITI